MKRVRKVIIILSAIVLIIILCYLATAVINRISKIPIEFTSEKWDKHILQRERMIDSLQSKYDFGKMNYDQIVELLGENGIIERSGKEYIVYKIGIGTISPSVLIFRFDKDGKLSETAVSTMDFDPLGWILYRIAQLQNNPAKIQK